MSTWEDKWLVKTTKKIVPDVNVWPNITIFNRRLYTFGSNEEAYIKFSFYDAYLDSYDDLAYYDTNTCIYRVSEEDYIVILTNRVPGEKPQVAVLGQLGERYLKKNHIRAYDVEIRNPEDYEIVHLSVIGEKNGVTFDDLVECSFLRVKKSFEKVRQEIRTGSSEHPAPPDRKSS